MYVPTFSNPRGLELAQSLASKLPVEIIFGNNLLAELRNDVPDEVEALFELEQFTGFRTQDGPEYTIILAEAEAGTEGAIVTHTAEGELGGSIATSDSDAIQWLERRYAAVRAESDRLDDL